MSGLSPVCYVCMKDVTPPDPSSPRRKGSLLFCSHECSNQYYQVIMAVNESKKTSLVGKDVSPMNSLPPSAKKFIPKCSRSLFTIDEKKDKK